VETESKLEVPDHTPIRERLQALGAECLGAVDETNVYFDRADELLRRDHSLRLRCDGRNRLTWKGPTNVRGGVTHRPEVEVEVSSIDDTAKILQRLGFAVADRLPKRRETWRLPGVEIALDTLAFGNFVEIEGDPTRVPAIAEQLGLDLEHTISVSYRRLQKERKGGVPT
jgi:predicted adenylyl cyclase CyaB